jgi:hypothetical protein
VSTLIQGFGGELVDKSRADVRPMRHGEPCQSACHVDRGLDWEWGAAKRSILSA